MNVKGSIAAFAVTAVFAGSAIAATVGDCVNLIGFSNSTTDAVSGVETTTRPSPTSTENPQNYAAQQGAWREVSFAQTQGAFSGNPLTTGCYVPKNMKGKTNTQPWPIFTASAEHPMTGDQCSLYQGLADADGKLWAGKLDGAWLTLSGVSDKIKKISTAAKPKLDPGFATVIDQKVGAAMQCIVDVMVKP